VLTVGAMYQTALAYGPFAFSEHYPLENTLLFTYGAIDSNVTSG